MKKRYENWTMPEWMEPYRNYFNNTGGNSVETLMRHLDTPGLASNIVLFTLAATALSQVQLLTTLHDAGKLPQEKDVPEHRAFVDAYSSISKEAAEKKAPQISSTAFGLGWAAAIKYARGGESEQTA
jgi:hypothetical protein